MTNWFLRVRFAPLFIALLLAGGIAVRLGNLATVPSRSYDEKTYTDQARKIALHGAAGQRELVRIYLATEKVWIYPPPSRVGYLWAVAGMMKLMHVQDARAGAMLSCVCSIASLVLLVFLGLRLGGPLATLYGLLALCFSPLDLTLACRAWQDAVFGLVGMCAVFCCYRIQRAIDKKMWYVLLVIAGCLLVFIKEAGLVVYGMCACWVFWVLCIRNRRRAQSVRFGLAVAASVVASVGLLAIACGGMYAFMQMQVHFKDAMLTSTYARMYQSGPWYSIVYGFWLVGPLQVIFCAIGVSWVWLRRTGNAAREEACSFSGDLVGLRALACFSALFLALASVAPDTQNLRYVSTLYVPFYLYAGLGVWRCVCLINRNFAPEAATLLSLLFVVLCVAGIMSDSSSFDRAIAKEQAADLSIGVLQHSFAR